MPRMNIKKLLLLSVPPLFLVFCWAMISVNIPEMDDYDAVLGHLVLQFPDCFVDLAVPHNEHRIALTKLVADVILFVKGTFDFRWMMLCGNFLLMAYGFLWWKVFRTGNRQRELIGVGILWLLLSLANRENIFWGMTSIQNVAVMLFAFLSFVLANGAGACRLSLGILCAVVATFSSGGGMFVWPSLLVCEWFGKRRRKHLAAMLVAAAAIAVLFMFVLPSRTAPPYVVQDVPSPGETVLANTTIMNFSVQITPMFVVRHIGYAASLFVSLMGGATAFPWACLVFGCVVLALMLPIAADFRQRAGDPVFGFLVFLIANAIPCAVFRASEFMPQVPSRYCIVSISILASTLYLTKLRLPSRQIALALVAFAVCCNFYWFGKMTQRAENLRKNFAMWPADKSGLYYPEDRLDSVSSVLADCITRGIYVPPSAKPGEAPPSAPLPVSW